MFEVTVQTSARCARTPDDGDARSSHWVPSHVLEHARERCVSTPGHYGIVGPGPCERRVCPRTVTSERAISLTRAGVEVACLITDVSHTGARLSLERMVTLPLAFELHCLGNGRSLEVKLAWQHNRVVGVRFCDPPTRVGAGVDLGIWLVDRRRSGPRRSN